MKALLHIVVALLLVALAAGCRPSEAERALRSAEALMETRPDSALTLLEAIDGSRLSGEPRARHALLLSQAYDKNYIDLTDDSLISIAYDYYSILGEENYRMLSAYYLSVIYLNAEDYISAITPALEAYAIACENRDAAICGQIESLLSVLFDCTYNERTAIDYGLMSLKHAKQCNNVSRIRNSYKRLAYSYLNLHAYDSALIYSDSLKNLQGHTTDACSEIDAFAYFGMNQYQKVAMIGDTIIRQSNSCSTNLLTILSVSHYYLGNILDSQHYAILAWNNVKSMQDSLDAIMALNLLPPSSDLPDKYELLEYLSNKQDSIIRELTNHSLYQAQTLFEREIAGRKQAALNRKWQTAITAAALCLLLALSLLFLVIYLKKQHRLRRLQSERDLFVLAAEFERLKNENNAAQQLFSQERQHSDSTIATLNSEIAESRNLCNELFISRFSWIDKLGNIYLDSDLASNTQQALHKKVKEELSAVKLSSFKKELVDIVNTYYDNLIARIEAQCPSLTASDMDYVVLSCVGLSPRVIAFLLSKTVPTIYNIKLKVRTKLKAEAPALLDEYCALTSTTR